MDKINVKIVQSPSVDPVKFIADSTRITFLNKDIKFESTETKDKDISIVKNLITAGHSPLEHCSYSILISGASRSFLAQIRTHRLASFTSASQHYINFKDTMDFEVPIEIYEKCEELNDVKPLKQYLDACNKSLEAYQLLQDNFGLNHAVARQATVQGARNNLLITANIRQWLYFIRLRECGRNTSETEYVLYLIRKALTESCPTIFENAGPACFTAGKCSEGPLCCGKQWTKDGNPNNKRWENVVDLGTKWREKLLS